MQLSLLRSDLSSKERSFFFTLLFLTLCTIRSFAQYDSLHLIYTDSVSHVSNTVKIRRVANSIYLENRRRFLDQQQRSSQKEKVSQLYKTTLESKDFLQKGIDTTTITQQLNHLETLYRLSTKDVFYPQAKFYSIRNLTTTKLLLVEISEKLLSLSKPLNNYRYELSTRRRIIDSLLIDSTLYVLPADTNLYSAYVNRFEAVLNDLTPIDSLLNSSVIALSSLDSRVTKLNQRIQFDIDKLEIFLSNLKNSMLNKEMTSLAPISGEFRSGFDSLVVSIEKAYHVLMYFLENNLWVLALLFLLLGLVYYALNTLQNKVLLSEVFSLQQKQVEIIQHPFLVAFFLILTLGQFLFGLLPFVFTAILWVLMIITLLLIRSNITKHIKSKLNIFSLTLFCLSIVINLTLEPSTPEVYSILLTSGLSVVLAVLFIIKRKGLYKNNFLIKSNLILFLLLESVSFLALLSGYYNLSKLLLISGFSAIITSICLIVSYHLILKILDFYYRSLNSQDNQNIFIKLKLAHQSNPWLFISFVSFGWAVVFFRNFYFYYLIRNEITKFIFEERIIGKYSFSIEGILVFFIILVIAAFLSKIVALVAGTSHNFIGGPVQKKGGIGNWLLLLRLGIIIMGVILAFAATGIAMDRLTIILGSLGVGIGFGLQNIVGNLFSGIILAFERPIEIGDQIEITGKTGRIKEIGIRSSKMVSLDGAEIIIPNNDLINQHVINWTLSNNQRRIELMVGVKYGTDLSQAKQILDHILSSNTRIEKIPEPSVLLYQFNSSSIDFRLLFWSDINQWQELKSEIILSIDVAFKEAKIEIPVSQQDIYIKEIPEKDNEESPK